MVFRVPTGDGRSERGHIDYRLARASVLTQYRRGELSRTEVCDAHPELRRAAREVGTPAPGTCPVCDVDGRLTHVVYVFGPRLPKHGRCISLRGELARLARRPGTHVAYTVEVCTECSWNHLVRRSILGDDPDADRGADETDGVDAKPGAQAVDTGR